VESTGHNKIFVLDLPECIRIRTGETGREAIGWERRLRFEDMSRREKEPAALADPLEAAFHRGAHFVRGR